MLLILYSISLLQWPDCFPKGEKPVMPQQLAFVPTDGAARVPPSERLLIRRHCMRQINKQPGSRRSKREASRAAAVYSRKEKKDRENVSGQQLILADGRVAVRSELVTGGGRKQASDEYDSLPPPPPSDWALFQFPEELDGVSQKLMHQCT